MIEKYKKGRQRKNTYRFFIDKLSFILGVNKYVQAILTKKEKTNESTAQILFFIWKKIYFGEVYHSSIFVRKSKLEYLVFT